MIYRRLLLLSLLTLASSVGFSHPAHADYGAVAKVAPKRFAVEVSGQTLVAPYVSYPEDIADPKRITKLFCVQHGAARDPFSYLSAFVDAMKQSNVGEGCYVVAFQWLTEVDIEGIKSGITLHDSTTDELLFYSGEWRSGNRSQSTDENPRPFRISNFEVLDRFLEECAERFPNLREVVITGHSAGGQVVNRFSIASQIDHKLAQERGISVRYVIFNPSSYLYLDDRRYDPSAAQVVKPTAAQLEESPGYNRFKYGLEGANGYFKRVSSSDLKRQFLQRDITYAVGEMDNDPNHKDLDRSASAMLQGPDRLSRSIHYFLHLRQLFGSDLERHQRLVIIPNVGHSSKGCFASAAGRSLLFGVGELDCGPLSKYGVQVNGE